MNIFILDNSPTLAATYYCDKHCLKLCVEIAQLTCSTANLNGLTSPYKTTHKNHPCSIWVRSSVDNWLWTIEHGLELCYEYTRRYGKRHKSQDVIQWCFDNPPELPSIGLTPFAQAMPDEYRQSDAVEAYRAYYRGAKAEIATWKYSEKPYWF